MRISIENKLNFRHAEQIIRGNGNLLTELTEILTDPSIPISELSRPQFNRELSMRFKSREWKAEPLVFNIPDSPKDTSGLMAKMDFQKSRVGVEIAFSHPSFIGIDLLKFQISSYSELDTIDAGVYVVSTKNFQKRMQLYKKKWDGTLSFEKVYNYLPFLRSAIQVPVLVYGIDIVD